MENQPQIDKIQIIIHGLLAAVGGAVRVLSENKKYSFRYYSSQIIISSFSGVLIGLLINDIIKSEHIRLAMAGTAGYAGSTILYILSEKLQKYLKIKSI